MCKEENLLFVEHENIKANEHLNSSRLHLNKFGDSVLAILVKGATCFKSDTNPRAIDLILTNRKRCFSNTLTTKTGLSDFHLMVSTVLKSGFVKGVPK